MKKRKYSLLLQLSLSIFLFFPVVSKHIIFDLGDVLIGTNKFAFARDVGLSQFFWYSCLDFKNPKYLHSSVMDILDLLGTQKPNNNLVATYKERPLPEIMCRWLAGEITREEVLRQTDDKITELSNSGYFKSKREKKIIENIIDVMFCPISLAKNTYAIPAGLDLITEIINQYGDAHDFYIISNWDPFSYDSLRRQPQLKYLFSFFNDNNIYISGFVGYIKPHSIIFQSFLENYGLAADECIFLDDQFTNILGAQSVGMYGIQVRKDNYENVYRELCSFLET